MEDKIKNFGEFINEDNSEVVDNKIFTIDNIQDAMHELKDGIIKLPVVNINYSTLGGAKNVSMIIIITFDEKSTWGNNIFENSKYIKFSFHNDGELNLIVKQYTIENKFRKAKCKSIQDAIAKINKYITEVQRDLK